jgi:hypothetical protein
MPFRKVIALVKDRSTPFQGAPVKTGRVPANGGSGKAKRLANRFC